ncbi:MSHA biogenesis protein MshK [Shewanella sp. C32]|uniref:MSHA biogenesis protein MshK n=1 Tax=Shewanella electrica TaxID=515560 RepID=A0ABT2FIE9_9GAMM|nr:MSHA biogenesis protein MshK [Shewanella electrica]MCH1924125.1 MSHA biogenesis protein MshK [Shewanella electrica]MCS4556028.1 MSHA biogenesis protein MshK [Shewanella electrica]
MLRLISGWTLLLALPVMAADLRDPTLPPVGWQIDTSAAAQSASDTSLVLNSIITGAAGKRAVINNQLYHVGDKVNGVAISAISDQQVSLANGNKLRLFPPVTAPNKKR